MDNNFPATLPTPAYNGNGQPAPLPTEAIETQLQALRSMIDPERQLSWLQLANSKAIIKTTLETKELELQGLLINFEASFPEIDFAAAVIPIEKQQEYVKALENLQAKIAEYNSGAKQLPEIRKGYTRYLDVIYDELMQPEKRAVKWETFLKAQQFFLTARKNVEAINNRAIEKQKEQDSFRAHFQNEYIRIAAEYRANLLKQITDAYTLALKDPNITNEGLTQFVKATWAAMQDIKPGAPSTFSFSINTREEMVPVFQNIPAPNYGEILEEAKKEINSKFSMFWQDKQNADAAIKFAEDEQKRNEQKIKDEAARSASVNTLMAQAGSSSGATLTMDTSLKPVQRKIKMVIDDSDPSWALKVASAFVGNWEKAIRFCGVKKYGNLSIRQMAAALDEAQIKVSDVQYEEIEK